ncbi:uncharacterized protein LOC132563833 [Ylistrum balloti]|uniref:uncharacterized protein LOC132563833 n=1 Tax=Ylistrum balloti TaxID=509963 RepID=UPI002905AC8D|nr:uncharacterized protein LOC132563833 [Ylistrum balloti]
MGFIILCLCVIFCITKSQESSVWTRHYVAGSTMICNPIICPEGFQLSFCKKNYTNDYCHRCHHGSIQPKAVDSRNVFFSREIPKCTVVETFCPPEASLAFSEEGKSVCQCDTSRGYAGDDFQICTKCSKCPPGMELKIAGSCDHCPPGTFKPLEGYGPCKPFTDCEMENKEIRTPGNTTTDVQCGELLSTTPAVSTTTQLSTSSHLRNEDLDDISRGENEKNIQTQSKEAHDDNSCRDLLLVSITQTIVLFMTLVIVTIFLFKIKASLAAALLRREKESYGDERRHLVREECDTGNNSYSNKLERELEYASLHQPETTETIYPKLNSIPCTPTAPGPSIFDV